MICGLSEQEENGREAGDCRCSGLQFLLDLKHEELVLLLHIRGSRLIRLGILADWFLLL